MGLRPAAAYTGRYPHQLSGGQRQRVSIARAMVLEPRLLIADEPVSMLDVSIRAGILSLLRRLSEQRGLAIVYISHDISTVRYLCRRTAVMYLGRIVEIGPTEQVLNEPRHPYTKALVAAVPRMGPGFRTSQGAPARRGSEPGRRTDRLRFPSALRRGAAKLPARRAASGTNGGRPHRHLRPLREGEAVMKKTAFNAEEFPRNALGPHAVRAGTSFSSAARCRSMKRPVWCRK